MGENRTQRRLAAILVADVVDYSRLMHTDEVWTLAVLKSRRRDVLDPLVARHDGRLFKLVGDGAMIEFGSAVNAVQCAVELQKAFGSANSDIPVEKQIVLRIGIHVGDVMVEGTDLYGDGVNIAARLEGRAAPGGILVSEDVFRHIRNKLNIAIEDLGLQGLKNIAEPIRTYRVGEGTESVPTGHAPSAISENVSIAVLPFTNMSGDPEQAYFSDGITEDIITELSRFRSLFVIARNSSFQFRDKAVDMRQVGRELGVRYLIEGSIRRAGDRIRLTAQLIEAEKGNHIWAERYDRDVEDIFQVQDELAHAIASTIGDRVEVADRERSQRLSPAALRAYDLVLRARAFYLRFTREDNLEAIRFAEMAIASDSSNARAHATLAHCHHEIYTAHWAEDREASLQKAIQFAQRAVQLDDSDSFAASTLGMLNMYRGKLDEARWEYERAIRLNPNDSSARGNYAFFLTAIGKADEAIEQFELAKRQNPFDFTWTPWLKGIAYFTARRYDDAIATLKQVRDPINEVRGWLAVSYAHAGRREEARTMLKEFLAAAERDMAIFPGPRLKDWESYWHGAIEYQNPQDFEHVFDGLRIAGMPE